MWPLSSRALRQRCNSYDHCILDCLLKGEARNVGGGCWHMCENMLERRAPSANRHLVRSGVWRLADEMPSNEALPTTAKNGPRLIVAP